MRCTMLLSGYGLDFASFTFGIDCASPTFGLDFASARSFRLSVNSKIYTYYQIFFISSSPPSFISLFGTMQPILMTWQYCNLFISLALCSLFLLLGTMQPLHLIFGTMQPIPITWHYCNLFISSALCGLFLFIVSTI
jgi:hypothetical protein